MHAMKRQLRTMGNAAAVWGTINWIIMISILNYIFYDLHVSTGDCAPIFVPLHVLMQIYCRKHLVAYILIFIKL